MYKLKIARILLALGSYAKDQGIERTNHTEIERLCFKIESKTLAQENTVFSYVNLRSGSEQLFGRGHLT